MNPLQFVMIGDLVDLSLFTVRQSERLGVPITRTNIQHLANRREMNGCPNPILRLRAADLYVCGDLERWFDAYILTHPRFLGGRLYDPLRKILETS